MRHEAQLETLAHFMLKPGRWDEQAEEWSKALPSDSPGVNAAWLAQEVCQGRARVCDIMRAGARVGFIVFTVTAEHELLVLGAYARETRENLLPGIISALDPLARQCEAVVIRFHTMRAGLVAKAQLQGFHVSEIVMRKAVR